MLQALYTPLSVSYPLSIWVRFPTRLLWSRGGKRISGEAGAVRKHGTHSDMQATLVPIPETIRRPDCDGLLVRLQPGPLTRRIRAMKDAVLVSVVFLAFSTTGMLVERSSRAGSLGEWATIVGVAGLGAVGGLCIAFIGRIETG